MILANLQSPQHAPAFQPQVLPKDYLKQKRVGQVESSQPIPSKEPGKPKQKQTNNTKPTYVEWNLIRINVVQAFLPAEGDDIEALSLDLIQQLLYGVPDSIKQLPGYDNNNILFQHDPQVSSISYLLPDFRDN